MNDPSKPAPLDEVGGEKVVSVRATLASAIQTRIFSGLVLALPIAITFWIIFQLYITLQRIVLDPIAEVILAILGRHAGLKPGDLPPWWERYIAPLIAIGLVLTGLYFLGYFVRTRLARVIDWVMLHLPGVTVIYQAIRNVFASLDEQRQAHRPQRVVLVPFPHPGTKALALVTKALHDGDTGRSILCVYVMTAVVPPAGFTLFVPEDQVVDVDWTSRDVFQILLSGGLTAPPTVRYEHGGPTHLIVPGHFEPDAENGRERVGSEAPDRG